MERGSRITLRLGVSIASQIQSGSGVMFLCGLLPILNSVGSWTLVKPDAMPSAFLGVIRTNKMKKKDFIKSCFFTGKANLTKGKSFGFTILLLLYYLHLPLVGT